MKTNSKDRTGSQLVDMTNLEVARRVGALISKFQIILPTLLTNDLLAIAEKFPDQFELLVREAFAAKRFGLEVRVTGLLAIEKAQEYVRTRFAESLALSVVSKEVGLSSFYFCKVFKKGTGLNFKEFVAQVRIEKARNLLLNPHYSVKEVAFGTGFHSIANFNKTFKKLVGEAPTKYRKRAIPAVPLRADIRTFADVG